MVKLVRATVVVFGALTLLTGVAYPLLVTAVAQAVFPRQADGSTLTSRGAAIGSELIGQPFSRPEYFWGRLSATGPVPYNAAASSGSNFGSLHPDLAKRAAARIAALRKYDPGMKAIPVDLVTASGSGLDPHISPAAAEVQVRRVAAARKLDARAVRAMVRRCTESRQFGVLGEPRVNVLRLNLALDGRDPE